MSGICEGRVCIITGAGRGIGREHALMLASQGAKVVVNDLGGEMDGSGGRSTGPAQEVVDEIVALGGEAIANGDDVSSWEGGERMVKQAVDTFGDLHVLVNNAGILRDRMLANMTEAEWDAVINVHLKGTFSPSRHAAAYWRERSKAGEEVDGRIINTSSPSGIYGNVGQTNYGAAKAGIAAFTIIAAKELARYGVTVNAIAPAAITRMTENLGMGQVDESTKEKMSPRWIAPIVTWLASPDSRGVSGRVFDVSGQALSVSEGWHRGPTAEPVDDPALVGEIVQQLVADARPNANMMRLRRELRSRPAAPDLAIVRPDPRPFSSDRPTPETSMPIDPNAVGATSPPVRRSWTSKDAILYALGVGAGAVDPLDELTFTTENTNGVPQQVLPTMAVVLGAGGSGAIAAIGAFNPAMLVHGEQAIELHGPIPVEGEVETVGEITGIYDKGKGAVVEVRSVSNDVATGSPLFTTTMSAFIRGRGRLGRRPRPVRPEEPGPRARARPHRRLRHPLRPGPPVPAVGRPQPAALRPELRRHGRLRPPDPPRAVHLRLHRTGRCSTPSAGATRRGSGRWRDGSPPRCCRASA